MSDEDIRWSDEDHEYNQEMLDMLADPSKPQFTMDQVHRWGLLWIPGYRTEFDKSGKIGGFIGYCLPKINGERDMLVFLK